MRTVVFGASGEIGLILGGAGVQPGLDLAPRVVVEESVARVVDVELRDQRPGFVADRVLGEVP